MRNATLKTILWLVAGTCLSANAPAQDSLEEAATDAAQVFIYGRESENEDLMREITDPDAYDAMAKSRSGREHKLDENIRVEEVEVTEIDGDHAVVRATYEQIHTKRESQSDVYLKRVDGEWRVTTPPESAE